MVHMCVCACVCGLENIWVKRQPWQQIETTSYFTQSLRQLCQLCQLAWDIGYISSISSQVIDSSLISSVILYVNHSKSINLKYNSSYLELHKRSHKLGNKYLKSAFLPQSDSDHNSRKLLSRASSTDTLKCGVWRIHLCDSKSVPHLKYYVLESVPPTWQPGP